MSNIIITNHQLNKRIRAYEVFDYKGKTFEIFCSLSISSSCLGFNSDYCLHLLTDNGWKNLSDNRKLGINEPLSRGQSMDSELQKLEDGFNQFKEYVKELYGI
jgi:hypothetical protein